MSSAKTSARPARDEWLFGRAPDLLIGCGLGYILSIPALFAIAETTGTTDWPAILITVMALFANSPHYGATILRVYEDREDRRKYVVFSVYVTIALLLVLGASTRGVWLSSLLITMYVTWSPWHFSGQNYGLTLMYLRRRGIAVDPTTKRLVYASFVLSAVLAVIAIHAGHDDMVFAPNTLHVANTPTIFYLPLPIAVVQPVLSVTVLAYLGCLLGAGWRLRRRAPLREFVPAILLVVTQALWFTVPAILLEWGQARDRTLIFAAVWINTAHSVQYLWVTAYYARTSEPGASVGRFLLKAFMAGAAISVFPAVLLAPELLGRVPWDVGLAATIFAVVNIHHFILDGAIWKLRDGRVARVLLRTQDQPTLPEPTDARRGRPWQRRLVWALAGLAVAAQAMQVHADRTIKSTTEVDRIEGAARILRWLGREGIGLQYLIGRRLAATGDRTGAIEQFRRSIEIFPTARVWAALGVQYRALGHWDLALPAFDAALELNPDFWGAHYRRAEALLALDPSRADPATLDQATASLERALELSPGLAEAALMLAGLQVESGQNDEAVRTLERASEEVDAAQAGSIRRELAKLDRSGAKATSAE